jgi:Cys-rich protein (TIGR04453 family)
MNIKVKIFQILSIVSLLFFNQCKNKVSQQCKEICQFSLQCIQDNQPNSLHSSKDRESFEVQCFNTCTMLQSEFLSCSENHKNSCQEYYSCLLRSDIFE